MSGAIDGRGVYITGGPSFARLAQVLGDVGRERAAQTEKWGEQRHLDGTGPDRQVLAPMSAQMDSFLDWTTAQEHADAARAACKANGSVESPDTWAAILLEEVFEALAEDDPAALRKELVQVAAVAVQWVERLDERAAEA